MKTELKIGIIGLDTSHVIIFSDAFNNPATKAPIAGAKVVAAWSGGSHDLESSISRVPGYTKDLQESSACRSWIPSRPWSRRATPSSTPR